MQNNVILRRLRYAFDLSDEQMMQTFASGGYSATRAEISDWLRPEQDEGARELYDKDLAFFLNGFIAERRGKREGVQMKSEKSLNNNQIFRKLKIALNLKDTDIIELFKLVRMNISKHEISALLRKPEQRQFRVCHDQFLRNFLYGLQVKHRPDMNEREDAVEE